jgi:hypothetical protein
MTKHTHKNRQNKNVLFLRRNYISVERMAKQKIINFSQLKVCFEVVSAKVLPIPFWEVKLITIVGKVKDNIKNRYFTF